VLGREERACKDKSSTGTSGRQAGTGAGWSWHFQETDPTRESPVWTNVSNQL